MTEDAAENESTARSPEAFRIEIETLLEAAVSRHRKHAYIIGTVGVVGLVITAGLGWEATSSGADYIRNSGYRTVALVFELVRSAAAAALLAAAVWGVLNLARASFDQATRYEKRLIAGRFLIYVLDRFDRELCDDHSIPLSDVMGVFKEWSDNVESAFTHVRFGSKANQDLAVSLGRDGAVVSTGANSKRR